MKHSNSIPNSCYSFQLLCIHAGNIKVYEVFILGHFPICPCLIEKSTEYQDQTQMLQIRLWRCRGSNSVPLPRSNIVVIAIDTTITNRTNGQRTVVSNRIKYNLKFCEGFSFNIMYTLILHQIYPNRTHARIRLLLAIFKIKYK